MFFGALIRKESLIWTIANLMRRWKEEVWEIIYWIVMQLKWISSSTLMLNTESKLTSSSNDSVKQVLKVVNFFDSNRFSTFLIMTVNAFKLLINDESWLFVSTLSSNIFSGRTTVGVKPSGQTCDATLHLYLPVYGVAGSADLHKFKIRGEEKSSIYRFRW